MIRRTFKITFREAKMLGFNKLHLLVEKQVYEDFIRRMFPHIVKGEEIVLSKYLRS